MNKISKSLAIAAFVSAFTVTGFAATRNRYQVPVNQNGITDTYALPCTPSALVGTANTAVSVYGVGKSTPLAEAGVVFWALLGPAGTAGDYIVFRDSATANSSSTSFAKLANDGTTSSKLFQFDPPIAVINGLSVDSSSGTLSITVCVRQADGDL